MNKTILMGRLTKDPEVKYLQNENSTAMARYTLAVDRRYRKDGKRELEKPTEERRRKMQADRRSAPSPCLDWNCQKEMKAVRLQGSISLNRENYRNNW